MIDQQQGTSAPDEHWYCVRFHNIDGTSFEADVVAESEQRAVLVARRRAIGEYFSVKYADVECRDLGAYDDRGDRQGTAGASW